jgi:hypothetical protein
MRRQYDFSKGRRGAVLKVPRGKTRITIRLDQDVLEWFRQQVEDAGGGNYQTLINGALREFIERETQPLENLLRGVLREELARCGGPVLRPKQVRPPHGSGFASRTRARKRTP